MMVFYSNTRFNFGQELPKGAYLRVADNLHLWIVKNLQKGSLPIVKGILVQ